MKGYPSPPSPAAAPRMFPPSELDREMESYLGFLVDHELGDLYEIEPLNRTLSENKHAFPRAARMPEQKSVRVAHAPAAATPLRLQSLGHLDLATLLHEARGRAAAARTVDELYAELDAFQHMPMRHEGAKALVKYRGAAAPDVLVIGDAPDADEDAAGLGFAGKTGAMIDAAMKAAGLDGTAMLGPCAFWRPAGGRPLTPEDISLNQPFLQALIRLAGPKALLLLGAGAVTSVLNLEQSLQKLRGRIISYGDNDAAIPVMASYTPAFLLRQPAAKGLFWRDLLTLAAHINKP